MITARDDSIQCWVVVRYVDTIPYNTGSALLLPKENEDLALWKKLASLSLILEGYFQTTLFVLLISITMFSFPTSVRACGWQMCHVTRYHTDYQYCVENFIRMLWHTYNQTRPSSVYLNNDLKICIVRWRHYEYVDVFQNMVCTRFIPHPCAPLS